MNHVGCGLVTRIILKGERSLRFSLCIPSLKIGRVIWNGKMTAWMDGCDGVHKARIANTMLVSVDRVQGHDGHESSSLDGGGFAQDPSLVPHINPFSFRLLSIDRTCCWFCCFSPLLLLLFVMLAFVMLVCFSMGCIFLRLSRLG